MCNILHFSVYTDIPIPWSIIVIPNPGNQGFWSLFQESLGENNLSRSPGHTFTPISLTSMLLDLRWGEPRHHPTSMYLCICTERPEFKPRLSEQAHHYRAALTLNLEGNSDLASEFVEPWYCAKDTKFNKNCAQSVNTISKSSCFGTMSHIPFSIHQRF